MRHAACQRFNRCQLGMHVGRQFLCCLEAEFQRCLLVPEEISEEGPVAEYLRGWLDGPNDLAPKTKERYRELAENQIIPQLGNKLMQRLKPAEIEQWHKTLVTSGAKKGGPLSARTVDHAHRVLHRMLRMALDSELVARNVAAVKSPSKVAKVKEEEVEILKADEISSVMDKLQGHRLRVTPDLKRKLDAAAAQTGRSQGPRG